jgi:hypothetical protein
MTSSVSRSATGDGIAFEDFIGNRTTVELVGAVRARVEPLQRNLDTEEVALDGIQVDVVDRFDVVDRLDLVDLVGRFGPGGHVDVVGLDERRGIVGGVGVVHRADVTVRGEEHCIGVVDIVSATLTVA